MKDTLTLLKSKQTGNIFAVLVVMVFGILSIVRLYPYENSLQSTIIGYDDWCSYGQYALDIKHHGLSIPMVNEDYFMPAGFIYPYFLALCFNLFGENNIPVYIIQSLMLGFSVAIIYWTFSDKMRPLTALIFLFTLTLFALLDVSKYYTFRMLSENLTLFLVSGFFYCLKKGFTKNHLSWQLAAAALMGLSILTRPNIFPFALVLIIIVTYYYLKKGKASITPLLLFVSVLILSSSILVFRNHHITGHWTWLPVQGMSFGKGIFSFDSFSFSLIAKKTLFCLGYLPALVSSYTWRPHWMLMWAGYFAYFILRLKNFRQTELWEVTVHLFILIYYAVLLLIAPVLGSYGFRLLIPALLLVLPFSFMAIDLIAHKSAKKQT
ncbi:MAG: glycosyltransferase family 39 protein [Bacteroidota bacterium]